MKVSQELSIDSNRHRVGERGGSGPHDINNIHANRLEAVQPEGVTTQLSKDSAKLTNKGQPDKGLFESSKP